MANQPECWSTGVLDFIHHSITPLLQFPNLLLLHRHIDGINARVRQWLVINATVESPKKFVPPKETCRGIIGQDAHPLRKVLAPFFRIELLLLLIQQFIELGIGIADARGLPRMKVLM